MLNKVDPFLAPVIDLAYIINPKVKDTVRILDAFGVFAVCKWRIHHRSNRYAILLVP